jgi:hypothetical protein
VEVTNFLLTPLFSLEECLKSVKAIRLSDVFYLEPDVRINPISALEGFMEDLESLSVTYLKD